MGFYIAWKNKLECDDDDQDFVCNFLLPSTDAVNALLQSSEEELNAANESLTTADIPCFSSFENGASRLNELLEFSPEGATFEEIGYQLMNSVKSGARVKYGENHSKLAAMMSLVIISNTRPIVVKPTPWGSFLTRYSFAEKADILKKLLLRDVCVKSILSKAFIGPVNYRDVVSFLSPSTMIRRCTNVKKLIEFILIDSEREIYLSNINWEVEVI
jgi:hypothetical protein